LKLKGYEYCGRAVALALAHLDLLGALAGAVITVWEYIAGSLLASYWGNRPVNDEEVPESNAVAVNK